MVSRGPELPTQRSVDLLESVFFRPSELVKDGASRPGDVVRVCLVSIPRPCPPGDKRGRVYKTTNLRTHGEWTLPDSEHSCGGA